MAILSGSQLCRAGRSLLYQCTPPCPRQPPPISGQHILATELFLGRGSCCSIDLGLSPCSACPVLPGTQTTTLGILLKGPWVGPCELLSESGLGCRLGASLVGPSAYGSETRVLQTKCSEGNLRRKKMILFWGEEGNSSTFSLFNSLSWAWYIKGNLM